MSEREPVRTMALAAEDKKKRKQGPADEDAHDMPDNETSDPTTHDSPITADHETNTDEPAQTPTSSSNRNRPPLLPRRTSDRLHDAAKELADAFHKPKVHSTPDAEDPAEVPHIKPVLELPPAFDVRIEKAAQAPKTHSTPDDHEEVDLELDEHLIDEDDLIRDDDIGPSGGDLLGAAELLDQPELDASEQTPPTANPEPAAQPPIRPEEKRGLGLEGIDVFDTPGSQHLSQPAQRPAVAPEPVKAKTRLVKLPVQHADETDTEPDQPATEEEKASLEIIDHLLWHKAMADLDDDGQRYDDLLAILRQTRDGEHVSIRRPFERNIALAFQLVLAEQMDPWRIDLGRFSSLYVTRARDEGVDLITAGRIILMAWNVLKLQSDAMVELAEELARRYDEPEPDFLGWEDIGDWDYDDEAYEYTRRIKLLPEAPIDEKVRRMGASRKVTLMELVDAFQEAAREVEERAILREEREKAKVFLKNKGDDDVAEMVHREDPEREQAELHAKIMAIDPEGTRKPMLLGDLHEGTLDSLVGVFNSVLFLATDRKVDLWQEQFPYGDILVSNNPTGADPLHERPDVEPQPEPKRRGFAKKQGKNGKKKAAKTNEAAKNDADQAEPDEPQERNDPFPMEEHANEVPVTPNTASASPSDDDTAPEVAA